MSDGGGHAETGGSGTQIRERDKPSFSAKEKEDLGKLAARDRWVADREERAARRNELRAEERAKEAEESQGELPQELPPEDERSVAHGEALLMDSSITRVVESSAVLRGLRRLKSRKVNRVLMREVKDLVSQRPEFRLTGEPQFVLDNINDHLERDSFGPARGLIEKVKDNTKLSYRDRSDVKEGIDNLIRERARTLVEKGDGEHFVACVKFLGERLRRRDLPEDTLQVPAITDALRKHAISVFQEHFRDPHEVALQLTSFYHLGLMKAEDVAKMPEIREFVGPRLVADFKEGMDTFVPSWELCERMFDHNSQTFQDIKKLVPGRIEEMFGKVEGDPRELLLRLSKFIKFGFISKSEVKKMPETVAGVQEALSRLDPDGGDDFVNPGEEKALKDLRAEFGK